ncbi:MAG: ribosome biogenesis GTPase Der [Verrucomicrobiaceae bacterium]|nr:ribosome biogenesis GTPase Der [Verrucomicrobiaceae bacterium]
MRKTVAIVGRPNVGKSALFNRLAGKNISIVYDKPGVTRDRIMAECRRGPEIFDIMDTGGIGESTDDVLTDQVQTEAAIGLEVADLLLFVVDSIDGVTPIDLTLAKTLRKVTKPVILVCNKADSPRYRISAAEFTKLGFAERCEVSAAHGLGIDELVERIASLLSLEKKAPVEAPASEEEEDLTDEPKKKTKKKKKVEGKFLPSDREPLLKLAIVGRPNAGKSSLVNALTREERAIVSPVAGTTRDSLDIQCKIHGKKYQLIDTAGIRRQAKIHDEVEAFSVQRAIQSIERADLCLLIVDCEEGAKMQDRKIAQIILEKHKPCIIVMNKWDLYKPKEKVRVRHQELEEKIRREFFFLSYAPIIMISAKNRENLEKLTSCIERVRAGAQRRVGTGQLNRILHHAIDNTPGPLGAGPNTFKLLYATQVNNTDDKPIPVPHFVLSANRVFRLQDSYLRFLESKIREIFPGEGLPFFLKIKAKPKLT